MQVPETHFVNGHRIQPPFPDGMQRALFALGCFWGAEKTFWQLPGVYSTAVGYAGGHAPNPDYRQVCSGTTGHAESVLVVFDPRRSITRICCACSGSRTIPRRACARAMTLVRSTARRSTISTKNSVRPRSSRRRVFQKALTAAHHGTITTEIREAPPFFYAEDYHQQYLAKNPGGYCPDHSCGVRFKSAELPVGEKA